MAKRKQRPPISRRDEHEQQQRQQREAVIAEFDAGDTEATPQAMDAALLFYRQAVNQLLRAIKLAPGMYVFTETSPAPYFDKAGIFDFPTEKVVYLERASGGGSQSSVDAPTASQ